jgi:hypothetical protein
MMVFKNGRYITTPRRIDEAIRHKILDFIGDMSLLGFDIHGDVFLYRSGHALNHKMAKKLLSLTRHSSGSAIFSPGGKMEPKYKGDNTRFIRDVTIVDGDSFQPSQRITKTWEIMNNGSQVWEGRSLKRIGPCDGHGYIISEPETIIPTTKPGETVQISVEIKTPSLPGHYLAEWKMIDKEGDLTFQNKYPLFVRLRASGLMRNQDMHKPDKSN